MPKICVMILTTIWVWPRLCLHGVSMDLTSYMAKLQKNTSKSDSSENVFSVKLLNATSSSNVWTRILPKFHLAGHSLEKLLWSALWTPYPKQANEKHFILQPVHFHAGSWQKWNFSYWWHTQTYVNNTLLLQCTWTTIHITQPSTSHSQQPLQAQNKLPSFLGSTACGP